MKTTLIALLFLLVSGTLFGDSLEKILSTASGTNGTSLLMSMDLRLARMKHGRDLLEARDEQARLAAESAFLFARGSYRKSLQTFYHEVIDAIFDAASADIDRRIASLGADSAREEQLGAEAAYRNGRVSEESLAQARIAFRTAMLDHEQSVWEFQEYGEALRSSTGLEWKDSLLPSGIPELNMERGAGDWIGNDIAVRRAAVAERIAEIRLEQLPGNASRNDRQLAEVELEKAELGVRQAQSAAERAWRGILQRGRSQFASLKIRREQLEIQEQLAGDAAARFQRGLISSIQRNQEQERALAARKAYGEAFRIYLKTLLEYRVITDDSEEDPK